MENYKENILKLKSERKMYKKRINELSKKIDTMLFFLHTNFNKNSITWSQLKVFTIGKLYTINEEVQLLKTHESEHEIRFEAHIKTHNTTGDNSYKVKEMTLSNELETQ